MAYALAERRPGESYWTSLGFLLWYRFFVGGLLLASALWSEALTEYVPLEYRGAFARLALLYWLSTALSIALLRRFRRLFDVHLSVLVLLDVLTLAVLMYYGGGVRTGMGVMLLVTLAASGLVGQGRLVVFYAACATLAVLVQQVFVVWRFTGLNLGDFMHAGVLSMAYFVVAVSARLLAARVVINETLAVQRGQALEHQVRLSQRIIGEMDDGVLVVDTQGQVQQCNPQADALLGPLAAGPLPLLAVDPGLHALWQRWQGQGGVLVETLSLAGRGQPVRVRLVPIAGEEPECLLFVEDMARVQAQAQQLKLAALGRLTAGIAHEIRNPLAAINHAAELLREDGAADARLMQIVTDNVARLDRIIRDVLEVGRRDRGQPEVIDLAEYLPGLLAEFLHTPPLPLPEVFWQPPAAPLPGLAFDRGQLRQVVWNLLANACRHGGESGPVWLWAEAVGATAVGTPGAVAIHVRDGGPGIPAGIREQVFEPFFTTHHQGTGLGLYLARELCESNGARLELLDDGVSGAHFRVLGRARGSH